jgi:hypothetical protein
MPIAHVKLGSVPGAHQTKSVEFPIPQRSTIMRAQILDGVYVAIDGDDHHKAVIDFKRLLDVGLKFRYFANVMKILSVDDRLFRGVVDVGCSVIGDRGKPGMQGERREPFASIMVCEGNRVVTPILASATGSGGTGSWDQSLPICQRLAHSAIGCSFPVCSGCPPTDEPYGLREIRAEPNHSYRLV